MKTNALSRGWRYATASSKFLTLLASPIGSATGTAVKVPLHLNCCSRMAMVIGVDAIAAADVGEALSKSPEARRTWILWLEASCSGAVFTAVLFNEASGTVAGADGFVVKPLRTSVT